MSQRFDYANGFYLVNTTGNYMHVWDHYFNEIKCLELHNKSYGLGHETVAVLLPGFAINW